MSTFARATLFPVVLALAACSSGDGSIDDIVLNKKPDYIRGTIVSTTYNGTTNDLLTGGLGKTGLGTGACPTAAVPASPTVEELRIQAICNNYRALVDVAAAGGYGTLYGPNVDANGTVTSGEGRIAGEEHIAYADDGSLKEAVTMMVQIPSTFSVANACIVTATSSGSRGVYGAIGTAGEWGLKRGCAVAYTDKGTGSGGHDLAANAAYAMRGTRVPVATAGPEGPVQFAADLSLSAIANYLANFPNRWAYKHAHSQRNPEKDWGRDTLRAVEFALYMLNQKYGDEVSNGRIVTLTAANTLVIASSVSNGAGAALAAAEMDTGGLIDGVAVAEPQVQVNLPSGITIRRGATTVTGAAKSLYDYFTLANLLQPCASVAAAAADSAGIAAVKPNPTIAGNRCQALAASGLVTGASAVEQGNNALAQLLANGWEAESIPFQASHWSLATLAVTVTYANTYARASVSDNLCGYSFGGAPVAGVPAPLSSAAAAQLFGTGNGVPPTSGINILNNNSVGGTALDAISVTPSTGKQDFNYDGALCLRNLLTNSAGATLRASIEALKRSGNLRGKAAIIVHGRADTLVPVNHTSRPYYAINKTVDSSSKLAYYEVTNAQHFDAFIDNPALPGYDSRLVPLHRYFNQAMDLMYAHLKSNAPLPPSQVVRTTPRGGTPGAAPAITASNVPPIAASPAAGDLITFSGGTLSVPD